MTVPEYYFGEAKGDPDTLDDDMNKSKSKAGQSLKSANEDHENEEDDSSDSDDETEQWTVQSMQGMSMTNNMIAQCQKNHKEFCFVVKPAPGSRKVNIVGF